MRTLPEPDLTMPSIVKDGPEGAHFYRASTVLSLLGAEREQCARVCELRGRALESARAHAEGSLQGAVSQYWEPMLSLVAELARDIRSTLKDRK